MIPVFISLLIKKGFAQDLETTVSEAKKTLKEDPFSVNGSLGLNSVFYKAKGILPRRDPFYWVLNAQLQFTLFNKVSVPFTAVVTQQDKNFSHGLDRFSQPFNQFGLSPKYRWLTVHAGFRSLVFSEYSLSGALFLGGGVEIQPKNSLWSGTAFYGRFVKAVPSGGVDGIVVSLPAYARWGGGSKIRVGTDAHWGEFSFLKIKDDARSIPYDTVYDMAPQENEVLTAASRHRVTPWLSAGAEISLSMFTKNLYSESMRFEGFNYVNQIYPVKTSTQFNKAVVGELDFHAGKYKLGLKYKRIDPDYRSLGAIFLTNDVEEISVNSHLGLAKGKVTLSTAAGVQQNNLDRVQALTARRLIVSLDVSYNITPQLNVSSAYSNFSSNSLPVRDVFNDTIRFVQLTQNGSFNTSYTFGKKNIKHHLIQSVTYQESAGSDQATSQFMNASLAYQAAIESAGINLGLAFQFNSTDNGGLGINEGFGPQAQAGKTFLRNKIRLNLSYGYQDVFVNAIHISKNTSAGLNMSYKPDKHQQFRVDCTVIEKTSDVTGVQEFTEWRGNMAYAYHFGLKRKTKKQAEK